MQIMKKLTTAARVAATVTKWQPLVRMYVRLATWGVPKGAPRKPYIIIK